VTRARMHVLDAPDRYVGAERGLGLMSARLVGLHYRSGLEIDIVMQNVRWMNMNTQLTRGGLRFMG
jgi:hypothetical protein